MTEEMIKELQSFCSMLARKKLVFISNNDSGVEIEDIISELVSHAYAASTRYDTESNEHLLNIAKKAARNHMIRMIEHHTAKKRSRVVPTLDGYQSTTLSLEAIEENGVTPNILQYEYDNSNLKNKLSHLPYPVANIVKIALGEPDEDFDNWFNKEGSNERSKIEKACEYYDIPLDGLQMAVKAWDPNLMIGGRA